MVKLRRAGIGAIVGAALLAFCMIWPLQAPIGTVLSSLLLAIPAGMAAVGLVLVYRSIRIINFLQVGLGAVTATLFVEFYTRGLLPFGLAIALGLVAGVLVFVIVGLVCSILFFRHPRLVLTIVTVSVGSLVTPLVLNPIIQAIQPDNEPPRPPQAVLGPWPDKFIEIGGLPFRTIHFVMFGLMLITMLAMVFFFQRTRFGAAIRAAAENADRASLLGINVKMLQVGVWTIAGILACVAALGPTPVLSTASAQGDPGALLLPFAAAVVAMMRSMPIAFFTAMGLVILRQAVVYETDFGSLMIVLQFVIIMVGLLLQRKKFEARADDSSSWKAVKEVRPTPREMLKLATIRRTRYVLFFLLAATVLGLPWVTGTQTVQQLSSLWVTAMIGASLVVLTGWTGQMSLGQFAIVAFGAFTGGILMRDVGLPFLVALPLSGAAGAVVAVLIGLPALRIKGLFLAITTMSISAIIPLLMFDPGGPLSKFTPQADVTRPKFVLNFEDTRSMYYLVFALFLLTAMGVNTLRKSRAGRVLIGMRDNEAGIQSFGIDLVRTKLTAFALSGFIAGLAGAVKISLEQGMGSDGSAYNLAQSFQIFIVVLIGGISTVMGAFLGAAFFTLGQLLFANLLVVISGVLLIVVLLFVPGGLAQMVFGIRDAVLRVIAMRQHIIVPSLFADYSPEAWERRLAPLAPASQSAGLAALRHDQRYARPSKVLGEAPA